MSAGRAFRKAVAEEKPLQVIGAICAYHALMAKRVGYRAIYLSGGGVAAGSLGMPDLDLGRIRGKSLSQGRNEGGGFLATIYIVNYITVVGTQHTAVILHMHPGNLVGSNIDNS